jgi:transglutaminase-like putative cysteine protease
MSAPPLLLAACLLLWGWQTDNLLLAVPMAGLTELPRYIRWRWDLGDPDFNRIADFSSALFLAMVVYQFTNRGIHAIYAILELLPVILFVLIAAQRYSARGTIRLSALFVSLRRKPPAPPHAEDREVDLAYPFALTCLLSASAGERTAWFFPCLAVVAAWLLWPQRPRRYRAPAWLALLALACGLAFAGQYGVRELQRVMERTVMLWFNTMMWAQTDPTRATTAIGAIGRLKLSDRIRVRVATTRAPPLPLLLREASYDQFGYGTWSTTRSKFEVVDQEPGQAAWPLARAGRTTDRLTITTTFKEELGVIPLPYGAARLEDEDVLEVQRNPLGTVQIEVPPGQVAFDLLVDRSAPPRDSPPRDADLQLPSGYRDAFMLIALEQGLPGTPPWEAVRRVETFFAQGFRYSLIQRDRFPTRQPLIDFLRHTRQGHCEYFASATVLLLRAAGVPARYTVGYSVTEYSPLERQYVARARHGHAWAEAWVDGAWRTVDTTPALWADLEDEQASVLQPLLDLWSWTAYQFELVRNGESPLTDYLLWLLAPLTAILGLRLHRRRRVERRDARAGTLRRAGVGLDSEFPALVARLEQQGFVQRPGEPLGPWVRRIGANHRSPTLADALARLLALHYRHRFDPRGLSAAERESLRARVQDCLREVG